MKSELVTAKQAATLFDPQVSRSRVLKILVNQPEQLPNAIKMGRDWLIPVSDIEALNKKRKNNHHIK